MIHVVGTLAALVVGGGLELPHDEIGFGGAGYAGNAADGARDRRVFRRIARGVRSVAGVRQIAWHVLVPVARRRVVERKMRRDVWPVEEHQIVGSCAGVYGVDCVLALALVPGRGDGRTFECLHFVPVGDIDQLGGQPAFLVGCDQVACGAEHRLRAILVFLL